MKWSMPLEIPRKVKDRYEGLWVKHGSDKMCHRKYECVDGCAAIQYLVKTINDHFGQRMQVTHKNKLISKYCLIWFAYPSKTFKFTGP